MLTLQVYSDTTLTPMLADFSGRIHPSAGGGGLRFTTNAHGFAALEAPFIPMSLHEAFECYDWPGTPHVVVSDFAAGVVWEGRLEDVAIVPGGATLRAFGYQRAMSDVLYTALWSYTGSGDWREMTEEDSTNSGPALFEMDNNNRLYIAPRKGETFATTGAVRGNLTWAAPHRGDRLITHFDATYDLLLISGWVMRIIGCDFDFANAVELASVTASGSAQSGSWSLTGINKARLYFEVRNATGADSTITADTGENYARLTGMRIKTNSGTVLASEIAAGLATYVNGINANQLSASAALIEATTTDLQDEIYEDVTPADVLSRLAYLHSYEWGVWEDRRLTFREKGSAINHWYVDASSILELQRSLERVQNGVRAVYRDARGDTVRSFTADDADSQARWGVIRRGVVDVQTTSTTEAQLHRDVYLADRQNAGARAQIAFDRLYDAAGALYPLWSIRAGDTVTIRNLPPTLSSSVDRIRTFVVAETDYDAAAGMVSIAPDEPLPTLDLLVARREAGF